MVNCLMFLRVRTKPRNKHDSEMEIAAFQACSRIITNKLDVKSILPELISHHLLTQKDHQFLINPVHEDYDKIQHLLLWLPRKGDGWFTEFLECLDESSTNTGHGDIASSLSQKLRQLEMKDIDNTACVSIPVKVTSICEDKKEVRLLLGILFVWSCFCCIFY